MKLTDIEKAALSEFMSHDTVLKLAIEKVCAEQQVYYLQRISTELLAGHPNVQAALQDAGRQDAWARLVEELRKASQ